MTMHSGRRLRISASSSSPFISAIRKSVSTRSNGAASIIARAARPLSAVSASWPSDWKNDARLVRIFFSSSTMSIRAIRSAFPRRRQLDHEAAAGRRISGDEDAPAVRDHDVLYDRQAQPRRALFGAVAILREAFENVVAQPGRDTRGAVGDLRPHRVIGGGGRDLDPSAAGRIAERV